MKTAIVLVFLFTAGVFAQTMNPEPNAAPPAKTGFEPIHATYVSWFIESEGFGNSRMISVRKNPPAEWNTGEDKYVVKAVNLIGIVNHEVPVVYTNFLPHETMAGPAMKSRWAAQTRALDDFEADALKQFIAKKTDVVTNADKGTVGSQMRIVGAIRAQASCIKCHEVEKGDLMGAFSYMLEKQAPLAK